MKKIILSLILAISFTFAFAQKSNVSKAKNKALMENPDYAGARDAIKLALKDSTTKNLAETWYVAGMIGYKENDALYQKALLNQSYDADVKGKAILESYKYYLEALRLDSMPNAKGKVKQKFTKEIKANILDYYKTQLNLIAYGAHLFDKKNYEGAIEAFGTYLEIPQLPIFKNEIKLDSTYRMIQYYTAIAATNAKKHKVAIPLYEDLKDKNYESFTVYQLLNESYNQTKDTVKAIQVLKEGCDKFPKEPWFLRNLINYYVFNGKTKEALAYLNTAIQREPNMAQYHYVKGGLDEQTGNLDSALVAFDKAIQLDPTLAEAYAGKGRLFFNKAFKMTEVANDIKDNKRYMAEMKKADDVFKQSVPFFQKAAELKPTELEYKTTLKTLYYRLKKDPAYEKKYDEIVKDIESMNK